VKGHLKNIERSQKEQKETQNNLVLARTFFFLPFSAKHHTCAFKTSASGVHSLQLFTRVDSEWSRSQY